jgi:DNA repair protein RecO (recombination protein O)
MTLVQTEAISLRTYPYSEAHKIVVFLSRDLGQVRAMAYGVRKSKKSRYGTNFEPLTHLNLTFSRKENQELATVRECEIIKAVAAYKLSFELNLHFQYFAELLTEFSNEGEQSDQVFRLTLAVIDAADKVAAEVLARYLELWLLQIEGVLPRLEEKLPADLARKILVFMKTHPNKLGADVLVPGELKRLERVSEELIECHLEKRLTAKRMLKELL